MTAKELTPLLGCMTVLLDRPGLRGRLARVAWEGTAGDLDLWGWIGPGMVVVDSGPLLIWATRDA